MGLDFLEKTAKTFGRSCQLGFERLKAAYVFDPKVAPTERSFLARLDTPSPVSVGDDVVLRLISNAITLFQNEQRIGQCDAPPASLFLKIREKGGIAVGQLSTLHEFSGTADVVVL
jgi:hypothetical protein